MQQLAKLRPAHLRAYWRARLLPRLEPHLGGVFPPLAGERWRAGVTGAYDEWAVIYDPILDAAQPSAELTALVCEAGRRADAVDLSAVAAKAKRPGERRELATWPGQHYRFLVALAEATQANRVVEIGTYTGASALAFLEASCVESVVTYDIVPWDAIDHTLLTQADADGAIEQRLGDLADEAVFRVEAPTLLDADLIFLDGPKDASFEPRFLKLLLELPRQKRQLLVIDDVKVMTMLATWQQFPLPKIDAATFGHWSGTGLSYLPVTP